MFPPSRIFWSFLPPLLAANLFLASIIHHINLFNHFGPMGFGIKFTEHMNNFVNGGVFEEHFLMVTPTLFGSSCFYILADFLVDFVFLPIMKRELKQKGIPL